MKGSTILIYRGQEITAADLAARKNLPLSTLASRIGRLKWSVEEAADTAPDRRFRKGGRHRKDAPRPCPELRKRPDGRAYCRWREGQRRRVRYFGQWDSADAHTAYKVFAAAWGDNAGAPLPSDGRLVGHLIHGFIEWAKTHYVKDGRPTSERAVYRSACAPLGKMFSNLPVASFKPSHLRAVRAEFVKQGLARVTCNRYAGRVVKVFAWGVGRELVPATVVMALREVESLEAGRTTAPEVEPVGSVPWDHVEKTLPHMHPDPARGAVLAAMVQVQTASGMRPGEVCRLVPEHIDRTATPWVYRVPGGGKSAHRGKRRLVYLGPRARSILEPFLLACPPGRRVFGWPFRAAKETDRWTAVSPTEYSRFVAAAAGRAGVESWTPNQLRHRRATDIHERYESDADVAAALGNTPEVARQVYVDSPEERVAKRIAEQTG